MGSSHQHLGCPGPFLLTHIDSVSRSQNEIAGAVSASLLMQWGLSLSKEEITLLSVVREAEGIRSLSAGSARAVRPVLSGAVEQPG